MYTLDDLTHINTELQPLKILADRELQSIYGLTGKVYTPHIDVYTGVSLKKAAILFDLKTRGVIPFSDVEIISAKLKVLHPRARSNGIVEYDNQNYTCKYSPLKLSKSGKSVRKWAKYWLLKNADGTLNSDWKAQVKEIWPEYFVIRSVEM